MPTVVTAPAPDRERHAGTGPDVTRRPRREASGRTPLATWLEDDRALARLRRDLGRRPVLLTPRDEAWRSVAPGFGATRALAASGVPVQVVAGRRYDRAADPRRLRRALAAGATVYLPQVHQVLPRLARLMVALRAALLGPFREECSFLFLVEGRGREGMGLHHDGDVDAFWLQLEGRRTVTLGPPVPAGTPEDLDAGLARRRPGAWSTHDLEPGTLLYLPPRTPHRVVCHGRSLALSLTWGRPDTRAVLRALADGLAATPLGGTRPPAPRVLARAAARAGAAVARSPAALRRAWAASLGGWDVVGGRVDAIPPSSRVRLWTQVPAVAMPIDRRARAFRLVIAGEHDVWLPAALRPLARRLALMPSFTRAEARAAGTGLARLLGLGILAPQDLPLRVAPADPSSLDGWNF